MNRKILIRLAAILLAFLLIVSYAALRSAFVPSTTATASPMHSDCLPPYQSSGPWNLTIAAIQAKGVGIHPQSAAFTETIAAAGSFGADPNQYTYPVYNVTNETPLVPVKFAGFYSDVSDNGATLRLLSKPTVELPIPAHAQPSSGTDGQLIVINQDTGDEYGFWRAAQNADGSWNVANGYHYNITWSGAVPAGFFSRGAGVTYLAGLIRPCEIAQGRIDHALAFAYNYPTSDYVYPATKSDGIGTPGKDVPEGARLFIDPPATDAELSAWCGDDSTCRTIVKALETYGMITIDNSGHAKIYAEDNLTANWGAVLTADTPKNIPLTRFQVLEFKPY